MSVPVAVRRARGTTVLTAALLVLAACGADEGAAPTRPSASSSPTQAACARTARCYEFTDGTDGWPEVNDDRHYAAADTYLDGTYRVGGRSDGSWPLTAPLKVSQIAPDFAVQVDAEGVLGQAFPDDAAWGVSCWTRPLADDRVAGFAAYVQPAKISLGLFDQSGEFQVLREEEAEGLASPGKRSRLTLHCRQQETSEGATARIDVEVNGAATLAVDYADTKDNFGWSPADGAGLLVAGAGSDVFVDRVVVSALS